MELVDTDPMGPIKSSGNEGHTVRQQDYRRLHQDEEDFLLTSRE